ncbi:MAG: 50S ribosomal protein L10 [Mariprofundaceae bacterium]|nr:50S ribosomal protein L10 [Mariprofundaceae bacterium]
MNRNDKQQLTQELHETWSNSEAAVVTHYRGLTVDQMNQLRGDLRQTGGSLLVVKNTLARRAAEGTDFAVASHLFSGPTAIAYGNDPVALAKAVSDFAKKNEVLIVLGGVLDGRCIAPAEVTALASLPSKEVLLSKLLGSLQSPISSFVRTLAEVPASFVRTLAAVRDQKESV